MDNPTQKGWIRADVASIVRGMAHRQSNIAAVHFDGPWLAECLRMAAELERVNIGKIDRPSR